MFLVFKNITQPVHYTPTLSQFFFVLCIICPFLQHYVLVCAFLFLCCLLQATSPLFCLIKFFMNPTIQPHFPYPSFSTTNTIPHSQDASSHTSFALPYVASEKGFYFWDMKYFPIMKRSAISSTILCPGILQSCSSSICLLRPSPNSSCKVGGEEKPIREIRNLRRVLMSFRAPSRLRASCSHSRPSSAD